MRRMFLIGSGGKERVATGTFEFTVTCSGGTRGIIGTKVHAKCPATMIATGGGTLLLATGYGPMLRMRQNESRLSPAGVPAPKLTPLLLKETEFTRAYQPDTLTIHCDFSRYGPLKAVFNSSSGVGMRNTPEGDLSLRERQGYWFKYSSIAAPLSGEAPYQVKLRLMSLFMGVDRVVPGGISTTRDEWRNLVFDLQVLNQASSGTTAFTTYSGAYQCLMRYVDKDGYVSDPSPISPIVNLSNAPYIYYTNLETPTDPRVVRRQIFRNENGNANVFYLDIDTDDITSDTLISRNTDAQLKLNFGQPVWDANGYNLFQLYGEPPTDKPYIVEFNSRVFAAGIRKYKDGCVSVTNGSTTVTGIGTAWPVTFQGRHIIIESRPYTIVNVDPDTQVITIDKAYAGATSPYANYVIQPYFANGNLLNWSEPGLPESWPVSSALLLNDDGDDITGLKVFDNSLWVLKLNSIYMFNMTLDPNRDGDYKPVTKRGCINARCAVQIQNLCIMLDRTGLHAFRGALARREYQVNSTPDHLSKPIGDLFRFESTWLKLNFDSDTCLWHGVAYDELQTVRYFVTMQGYDLPMHAVCYDYLMDRAWVEEYPIPIGCSTHAADTSGRPLLGGYGGKIYNPDLGSLDFVQTTGTRLTVTSCVGGTTLVLSDTPPSCVGVPVCLTAGKGRGQMRMIYGQSGNEIYLNAPLDVWADATTVVQIGGIKYYAITGEYNYAKMEVQNPHAVSVTFSPIGSAGEMYISILNDGRNAQENMVDSAWGCVTYTVADKGVSKVDLNNRTGYATISMDTSRERDNPDRYSVQATIQGFSGLDKPVINNIYLLGPNQKQDAAI